MHQFGSIYKRLYKNARSTKHKILLLKLPERHNFRRSYMLFDGVSYLHFGSKFQNHCVVLLKLLFARGISCGPTVSRISTLTACITHFRVPFFYFGCVIDVSPVGSRGPFQKNKLLTLRVNFLFYFQYPCKSFFLALCFVLSLSCAISFLAFLCIQCYLSVHLAFSLIFKVTTRNFSLLRRRSTIFALF